MTRDLKIRPDSFYGHFRYDVHGNRTRRWVTPTTGGSVQPPTIGVDVYSYDRWHRLVSVSVSAPDPRGITRAAGDSSFRYDARSRRILRQDPGATPRYCVFSGGLSVQEWDLAGLFPPVSGSSSSTGSTGGATTSTPPLPPVPVVEYIRGSDYGGGIGGILYTLRRPAPTVPPAMRLHHYNARGDVIAHSDASGQLLWQGAYLAYGTHPVEKGTNPERHRANTKEEDRIGLLNEGHRYRCLETGSFITRDPAGFVDGPNLYAYVGQNPWSKFDPEGLEVSISETDSKDAKTGYVKKEVDIKLKGVVISTSKSSISQLSEKELTSAKELIKSTIESTYSGRAPYSKTISDAKGVTGGETVFKTTVELRVVSSAKDIKSGEHVFDMMQESGGSSPIGGNVIFLDGFLMKKAVGLKSSKDVRSAEHLIAHEAGHSLGLQHPANRLLPKEKDSPIGIDETNPIKELGVDNVMRYNNGREVSISQMIQIKREYDNRSLNRDTHSMIGKGEGWESVIMRLREIRNRYPSK